MNAFLKNERNMTALKARHEQKSRSRRAHTTIIAQYERLRSAMVVHYERREHDMKALTFIPRSGAHWERIKSTFGRDMCDKEEPRFAAVTSDIIEKTRSN